MKALYELFPCCRFSLCQRTAAAPPNTRIIHVPLGDIPSCFDASLFANMALAGADAGIAGQAARMGNPGSDKLIDDFLVLLKHAGDAIGSGKLLELSPDSRSMPSPLSMQAMPLAQVSPGSAAFCSRGCQRLQLALCITLGRTWEYLGEPQTAMKCAHGKR